MANTLLIIEDETLLGTELQRYYRRKGWDVEWVKTIAESERILLAQHDDPLVVLSDMNLPDGNCLDLLEEVREQGKDGEWVILTGYGSVPDSVRALRLGAFEFLEKPCAQDRLELVINAAARSAGAQRRLRNQANEQTRRYSPQSFAGHSKAAHAVREMLLKLSSVPFTAVIITGETGTGKGLVARILHHSGPRAQGPLVELNCAALPRELLESELFGHEAGAFTGAKGRRSGLMEQASGGTLFLDEIGEMDIDLQAKLLKALEDRTIRRLGGNKEIAVDVQLITATNLNLQQRVSEGAFRADLYHRLSVFRVDLPPLRARTEDVRDLVPLFIAEFNVKAGKRVSTVPDAIWEQLQSHSWPGNVRELRNVVERCVLFSDNEQFPAQWLQLESGEIIKGPDSGAQVNGNRVCLPLDGTMALDDMDRYIIKTTLEHHHFNVTATARALGTTRETLRYRIQKYGLKHSP
jgi:two-component system response regulator AtoC